VKKQGTPLVKGLIYKSSGDWCLERLEIRGKVDNKTLIKKHSMENVSFMYAQQQTT
jgi:hypothetical protein